MSHRSPASGLLQHLVPRGSLALVVDRLMAAFLGVAMYMLPPSKGQVLVTGWPDNEGNAVAMLQALAKHEGLRVVRLVSDYRPEYGLPGVALLSKTSLAGIWAFLRAEFVFFTHGLYGSPRSCRGRTFVNLWHGDGPKRTENITQAAKPHSDFVVSGTQLWGEYKAQYFGLPLARALVVGNPRVDLFDRPLTPAELAVLGITERYILWMPTYRQTHGGRRPAWVDSVGLSTGGVFARAARRVAVAAAPRQVVVKPHPLDVDVYTGVGATVVDNDGLTAAGIDLYRLIGSASALITDYSSVWTDFLILDRPVALYCPDLDVYEAGRGLNVASLVEVAPGPVCRSEDELVDFVATLDQDPSRDVRRRAVSRIGLVRRSGVAETLWQRVAGGNVRPQSGS